MHIIVINNVLEFDSFAEEWRALESQVPHCLPFQTYDWNRCWWTIFSVQTGLRRDHLSIKAFYDQGKLVAVAPYVVTYLGRDAVSLYRYSRPFGADPNLTEIRTPLIKPGYEKAVFNYLLTPAEDPGSICVFAEQQVIVSGSAGDAFSSNQSRLQQEFRPVDQRYINNYILDLANDWESFRSGLKRNIKESIRHCYNSLAREQLTPVLSIIRGSEISADQLALFYRLHQGRANAQATVQHPDYFAHPQHKAFLEALLQTPFADKLMFFCLNIDEKTVAIRIGFLMGDELYLYYSGYDLTYAKYSVMTTLLVEIMRWAMTNKILRLNLSVGEDVSKTRWGPRVVGYTEYQLVKKTWWRYRLGRSIVYLRKRRRSTMTD